MSYGDDPSTDPYGFALAPKVVSDPATRQSGNVYQCGIHPVYRSGRRDVEAHARVRLNSSSRHEECEQSAHPVVRETLPHLREEERRQPPGVSEKGSARGRSGVYGAHDRLRTPVICDQYIC